MVLFEVQATIVPVVCQALEAFVVGDDKRLHAALAKVNQFFVARNLILKVFLGHEPEVLYSALSVLVMDHPHVRLH